MTQTVSVSDARSKFAEIINRIQYQGETFIVKKQGKVVARIIGASQRIETPLGISPPVFSMGGANSVYSRDEIYE